ncbi:GGDEF domain-containing response regulator [Zoogloea oleivorans]|jgi:diguanylate cyclase (GGDEF)-like protein|uniref:GGDEF domain-containing response regulator n=1 Tax=Zoogloea oleivorans TaxID=1552750 RepID=UPI00165231FA|nr:GGDEF domain-containing response regulator [Zoogloea oleivorans]
MGYTGSRHGAGERKLEILVIDDCEDDAFLLGMALNKHGLKVLCTRVDTAPAMRNALDTGAWDIVISDHCMPGFDSGTALQILKDSGRDIPFVIYSGVISDQLAFSSMLDGVSDYVPKGNYARLVPVISRELRGAAARKAVRDAGSQLQELAYFDPLSKLPNRQSLCAHIAACSQEAKRHGKPLQAAVFHLDLDRFQRINSSFGYESGNALLLQAAQRLLESSESHGFVARLGGDAFGVFVPGVGEREGAEVFARWLLRVFELPFAHEKIELFLSVSIGVALVPGDGCDVFELLTNSELAMSAAKRQGGNSFRFYDRGMHRASAERVALENDLRFAIERKELWVAYQPCVGGREGHVVSAEALLRWNHPTLGSVAPDRFIPIAEENGLIVELGEWIMRVACNECRRWHDMGRNGMCVSVNVSAVQFGQPRLIESVRRALDDAGLPAWGLQLEITESSLMKDAETAVAMLRAFKNMGVRLAIDDFGTGYSSLAYLKRFPVDVIKIDQSFVRGLCDDEEDAAIVRAIIVLARSMRLEVIAEGVESLSQVDVLRTDGCELFQGYFFGRPVEAERFRQVLSARSLSAAH